MRMYIVSVMVSGAVRSRRACVIQSRSQFAWERRLRAYLWPFIHFWPYPKMVRRPSSSVSPDAMRNAHKQQQPPKVARANAGGMCWRKVFARMTYYLYYWVLLYALRESKCANKRRLCAKKNDTASGERFLDGSSNDVTCLCVCVRCDGELRGRVQHTVPQTHSIYLPCMVQCMLH